jgi:hypothetical protein
VAGGPSARDARDGLLHLRARRKLEDCFRGRDRPSAWRERRKKFQAPIQPPLVEVCSAEKTADLESQAAKETDGVNTIGV